MFILKKGILLIIIVIMISLVVQATNFYGKVSPITQKITKDEVGEYNIFIINEGEFTENFRVYSLNYPDWDIYTDPVENPILVTVPPKQTRTKRIKLDPLNKEIIGTYIVPINIRSLKSNEKISLDLPITVTSGEKKAGEYVPTVLIDIDVPKEIDPRQKISIKIKLSNQNILNITNLVIKIDSNLIKDSAELELGPKEQKTVEITESIDPLTAPQKDTIAISILRGNETIINPTFKRIEILPYSNIDKLIEPEHNFLRTKKEIIFKNEGNVKYKGKVKAETSFFRAIFSSTDPKARLTKENSQRFLEWEIELGPQESVTYYVNENYYILFIIIALILLIILGYFKTRSPLILKKSSSDVREKEGGISELKVVLHIKNRGDKPITNLEIRDKIPHLVNIERGVSIGTLHPTKILKHEHKGTIVIWHIDKLEPNDERVINYKVTSNLPIIGSFTLPYVVAKFKYDGKNMISHSNRLTVSI